jgi:hypothetical protein
VRNFDENGCLFNGRIAYVIEVRIFLEKEMENSQLNPNRHELLLYDPYDDPRILGRWIEQELCEDTTQLIFIECEKSKIGLSPNLSRDAINISLPINNLQDPPTGEELWRLRRHFRHHIWTAIKEKKKNAVFINNLYSRTPSQEYSLLLEKLFYQLFYPFYGFQVICVCLCGMNNTIHHFLEIVPNHTAIRVQCDSVIPRQHWPFSHYQQTEGTKTYERDPFLQKTLSRIALTAVAETNDPFIFQTRDGENVGAAATLPSLIYQLESLPIDLVCYHCFRKTEFDLRGEQVREVERSDLALWLEYTIGDSQTAKEVYESAKKSIGYYYDIHTASDFAKKTTLKLLINILENRFSELSNYL